MLNPLPLVPRRCSSFSLPSLRHLITPPPPSSLLEGNALNGAIGNAALEGPGASVGVVRLCHCKSTSLILFVTLISSPGATARRGTRPCFGFLMADERAEISSAQHGALQTGVCSRSCRRCCVRGSSRATNLSARRIQEVAATRGGSVRCVYGARCFSREHKNCLVLSALCQHSLKAF